MDNIQSSKRIGKQLSKFVFIPLLIIFLVFGILNTEVLAAEAPRISKIGFTSDIHGNTSDFETWLNGLKNSGTSSLNHFVFGGDFEYNEQLSHIAAADSVAMVKNNFRSAEIYTARGNHDVSNVANFGNKGTLPITNLTSSNIGYNTGLVENGPDYAIYIMDLESHRQTFLIPDIFNLATELNRIDHSKPVFVVSHFPIHQWSIRTTENALNLINVLNNHNNVVFLWGHNHSLPDPTYGSVRKADYHLRYADYTYRQIGFTYASMGAMYNETEVRGNSGLLTTIKKYSEHSDLALEYKNLSGSNVSTSSVTITSESPKTHTIQFESNGGSAVNPIKDIPKYSNIELPQAPTREGFVFEGWFSDDRIFENKFIETEQITEDITLYAKWTDLVGETYTVTFNSNGGSSVSPIVNVVKDATVNLPAAPTKEGFVFEGWFTDAGLTSEFTEATKVSKDITVYAKWEEVVAGESYTITFNTRGGSAVDPITGIAKGSTVKLPETFKEGYVFVGWYTDLRLTNEFTEDTPVTENITLYPKGVRAVEGTYTVTFNSNGGSSVSPIVNVAKDSTIKLPAAPTKEGFVFEGWFTDTGLSNEFTEVTKVNKDVTLYAKWTDELAEAYTVTFNSNGGSSVSPIANVEKGATINLPAAPTKEGYVFEGWFTDTGLTSEFTKATKVNKDMTLYAKWGEVVAGESYTITFNTRGGSAVDPITGIAKGSTVKLPETFKEGYVFVGWYTDLRLTNEFTEDTPVTENITLYPKGVRAVEGTYTVTFNSNGGSSVSPIANIKKDATVSLPAAPTKEGFVFDGWFTDAGLTSEFTEATKVSKDITVYAKWEEVAVGESYTITFNTRGGSAVDPITDIAKGSTVKLPETFKEGYVFVGWYTDLRLRSEFTEDTPVTENITLYPKGVKVVETNYSGMQSLQKIIDETEDEGESWITEIEIID